MKLDRNGFLVQKYLICNEYNLPNTICELARLLLKSTFLYSMGIAVFVAYLYGAYISIMAIFTNYTFPDFIRNNVINSVSLTVFATLTSIFVLCSIIMLYEHIKQTLDYNRLEKETTYKPNVVVEFSKGIWSRIKDKTCVIITYE